jgi:hypothetical protein
MRIDARIHHHERAGEADKAGWRQLETASKSFGINKTWNQKDRREAGLFSIQMIAGFSTSALSTWR